MFPNLNISNLLIPLYPLCVATGFLFGSFIIMQLGKKLGISENQSFVLMLFVEIGVIFGGKIFFLLINMRHLPKIIEKYGFIAIFTKTGFIFFGGLFGGILAILIYSKIYNVSFRELLTLVLSTTPFIHAIGRIGCFCAGCCYGIEYDGIGSIFMHEAERFPVQLLEANLDFILFIVLLVFFVLRKKLVIPMYFAGYGIIRFLCELFRGDISRGFIGCLSISSWISIFCLLFSVFEFFQIRKK